MIETVYVTNKEVTEINTYINRWLVESMNECFHEQVIELYGGELKTMMKQVITMIEKGTEPEEKSAILSFAFMAIKAGGIWCFFFCIPCYLLAVLQNLNLWMEA